MNQVNKKTLKSSKYIYSKKLNKALKYLKKISKKKNIVN